MCCVVLSQIDLLQRTVQLLNEENCRSQAIMSHYLDSEALKSLDSNTEMQKKGFFGMESLFGE